MLCVNSTPISQCRVLIAVSSEEMKNSQVAMKTQQHQRYEHVETYANRRAHRRRCRQGRALTQVSPLVFSTFIRVAHMTRPRECGGNHKKNFKYLLRRETFSLLSTPARELREVHAKRDSWIKPRAVLWRTAIAAIKVSNRANIKINKYPMGKKSLRQRRFKGVFMPNIDSWRWSAGFQTYSSK